MRQEKVQRLENDITDFLAQRMTLNLSTITSDGLPFASYAPFALGEK